MVAVLESKTHRSFKFPATPTRWDLKDRIAFPQWHTDLRRVVKYATSPTFLGSQPPPFNVASAAGPTTRSAMRGSSTSSATHAHAHAPTPAQEEWLQHNILLYDILTASVTLTEDQLDHVERAFGAVSDGNAMYEWVVSHADDTSLSAQIVLKQSLKKLTIGDAASAEEVDEVFRVIQVTWPKIAEYDNSSSSPMIEFALSLFPASYAHKYYLAAVQMFQDGGGRWLTFAAFRKEIIERLKVIEARDGPPVQQSAFPAMHAGGEKRMHASTCNKCDISFCDGKDCIVFNTAAVRATGSAKRLVHYLRLYAKEQRLKSMKGVMPPDDWFKKQKENAKKKKSEKEKGGAEKSANPVVPLTEDDDDMDDKFWEALDGAGSTSVFMHAQMDFNDGRYSATTSHEQHVDMPPQTSEEAPQEARQLLFRSPSPSAQRPVSAWGALDSSPSNANLFHSVHVLASRASAASAVSPSTKVTSHAPENEHRLEVIEREQQAAAANQSEVTKQLAAIAGMHARFESRLHAADKNAESIAAMVNEAHARLESRLDAVDSNASALAAAVHEIRQLVDDKTKAIVRVEQRLLAAEDKQRAVLSAACAEMLSMTVGLVFGGGRRSSAADLEWQSSPSHNDQLDVRTPSLAYFVVCDGDLRADRSVSGIVHKFAGAAISVQSVRQHSIAIDAHSSECFTASTAACQAVAFRGMLTELRISQEVPTPIFPAFIAG